MKILNNAGLVEATLCRMGQWLELAPRGLPIENPSNYGNGAGGMVGGHALRELNGPAGGH